MQLVLLSSRPDVLAETLVHQRHFMPWIDEVVVATPEALRPRMAALPGVTALTDEELTGVSSAALASMDHLSRNSAIRRGLGHHHAISEQFLMADDDARPLKPIDLSFFVDGTRHRCFYFYDLDRWPGSSTPFDDGQHHARELLTYLGYDRLAFGSHMPQAIHKAILAEVWDLLGRLTDSTSWCEWTMYFNVGRALHPDAFCDPEPFRTFGWPQFPHEWPLWVRPPEYAFENFYPELHQPGHLFDGLPTALDPDTVERTTVEKILRRADLGERVEQLDFRGAVANPWTGRSWTRRGAFSVLRRARRAHGYLTMTERSRLSELSGSVRRIDEELRRLRSDPSS